MSLPEKLKLEKAEELKLYFFIGRKNDIRIEGEKCISVLAYDLETALKKARESEKDAIVYHGQSISVRSLTSKIAQEEVSVEKGNIPQVLGKEQFKRCLLLSANELVKDPLDKESLMKIINKIE